MMIRRTKIRELSAMAVLLLMVMIAGGATTGTSSCHVDAFTTFSRRIWTLPQRSLLLFPTTFARVSGDGSPPLLFRTSSQSPSTPPTSTTAIRASTPTTTITTTTITTNDQKLVILGKKRLAAAMAFLTGWADMVLNVRLGTFCSMMTGNLLWMLRAVCEMRFVDGLYYASVMAAYCVGLVVYRRLQLSQTENPSSVSKLSASVLPIVGGTVTLLFVLADALLARAVGQHVLLAKWLPACLLSSGFAMINSVGTDSAGTMTFVITGHLTKLTTAVVDDRAAAAASASSPEQTSISGSWLATLKRLTKQPGLVTNAMVLLGFMGGAVFANALRLSGVFALPTTMGEFGWIGILFGGIFLWKHYLERGATSQNTGGPWKQYATQLIRRRPHLFPLVSKRYNQLFSTSSFSALQEETTLAAWNGTEYSYVNDQDLLDSTFASDLIVPTKLKPPVTAWTPLVNDTTLDHWASIYSSDSSSKKNNTEAISTTVAVQLRDDSS